MANKILVVDDHADILNIISINLQRNGYEVFSANSAFEALKLLKNLTPDLIISDLLMPNMDGLEFYNLIREDKAIPFIPFIILTAVRTQGIENFSFSHGVDEYLTKPIMEKTLIRIVEKILKDTEAFRIDDHEKIILSGEIKSPMDGELLSKLNQTILMRRTGVFEFLQDQVHEAFIWLKNGHIINSTCKDLNAEEAIEIILGWKKGEYIFQEIDISHISVKIKDNSMNVLIDICRKVDEKQ